MEKFVIAPLLYRGADRAQTARQLARSLGWSSRRTTLQIEHERSQGAPICASCADGSVFGYYLPRDEGERRRYVDALDRRISTITNNRNAVASAQLYGYEKKEEVTAQ